MHTAATLNLEILVRGPLPDTAKTIVPIAGSFIIRIMDSETEIQVSGTASLRSLTPLFDMPPLSGTATLSIWSPEPVSGKANLNIENKGLLKRFSASATFQIENKFTVPLTGTIDLHSHTTGYLSGTTTLNIGSMEPLMFFTHCTSEDNKTSITDMRYLRRNRTSAIWKKPLAEPNAPMGVYFAVTMMNGRLPTTSPYGTERVLVPVQRIHEHVQSSLDPVLYLEAQRPNAEENHSIDIRLILLRGDDQANIDWCKEHCLQEFDIRNNPWLMINDDRKWMTWKKSHLAPQTCRVLFFIADNVNIGCCEWDSVICTRRCIYCSKYGHIETNCPQAVEDAAV